MISTMKVIVLGLFLAISPVIATSSPITEDGQFEVDLSLEGTPFCDMILDTSIPFSSCSGTWLAAFSGDLKTLSATTEYDCGEVLVWDSASGTNLSPSDFVKEHALASSNCDSFAQTYFEVTCLIHGTQSEVIDGFNSVKTYVESSETADPTSYLSFISSSTITLEWVPIDLTLMLGVPIAILALFCYPLYRANLRRQQEKELASLKRIELERKSSSTRIENLSEIVTEEEIVGKSTQSGRRLTQYRERSNTGGPLANRVDKNSLGLNF